MFTVVPSPQGVVGIPSGWDEIVAWAYHIMSEASDRASRYVQSSLEVRFTGTGYLSGGWWVDCHHDWSVLPD